jgi:predicted negative regulator of RcsB-dependent stress response
MVEHRTDEERVAAIVRFFDNYKTYIIWSSVGLALITIIFLSVNSYQTNQNYEAYSVYQKWLEIDPSDEDKVELANNLFKTLQDDYSFSGFYKSALLIESTRFAKSEQLDKSLDLLRELKNSTSRGNLFYLLANRNIARIEISLKNYDAALKALNSIILDQENSTILSLKGDALLGLGRTDHAITQYQKALDISQVSEERLIIEYKLSQLN